MKIRNGETTEKGTWRVILSFALPYLFSCFLQTLYGMVDLYVIGLFSGADQTTAVSIGSQVMHMVTLVIVGLAMGSTVLIATGTGARRSDRVSQAIGNTIVLFAGAAVLLTILLLLLREPIVSVMSTPDEAVSGTLSYLSICFAGIPFITAYNIISAVFRGLGDSRTPMVFVAIACGFNIALDFLLIGTFGMKAAGAALATVTAQALSVICALIYLCVRRGRTGFSLSASDLKPRGTVIGQILRIGTPVALQDGCVQIAFLLITVIANQRGLTDAAAVGIVEKIITFLFLVPSAMLSTVSALGAQQIGAGRPDRAEGTLGRCLLIACGYGLVMALIMQPAAVGVVSLFTTDTAVAAMGAQYLHSYSWDCLFAGFHFCMSGYFSACGRSEFSFLHNILSLVLIRVPGAYFASALFPESLFPMGIAAPAGSLFSSLICIIVFAYLHRKRKIAEHRRQGSL